MIAGCGMIQDICLNLLAHQFCWEAVRLACSNGLLIYVNCGMVYSDLIELLLRQAESFRPALYFITAQFSEASDEKILDLDLVDNAEFTLLFWTVVSPRAEAEWLQRLNGHQLLEIECSLLELLLVREFVQPWMS